MKLVQSIMVVLCLAFLMTGGAKAQPQDIGDVAEWAMRTVRETCSIDYASWKDTLIRERPFYSEKAWKQLGKQMSPFLEAITTKKLSIRAEAAGSPVISEGQCGPVKKCLQIEFPLSLTRETALDSQSFTRVIRVLVTPSGNNPDGLEIDGFSILQRGR